MPRRRRRRSLGAGDAHDSSSSSDNEVLYLGKRQLSAPPLSLPPPAAPSAPSSSDDDTDDDDTDDEDYSNVSEPRRVTRRVSHARKAKRSLPLAQVNNDDDDDDVVFVCAHHHNNSSSSSSSSSSSNNNSMSSKNNQTHSNTNNSITKSSAPPLDAQASRAELVDLTCAAPPHPLSATDAGAFSSLSATPSPAPWLTLSAASSSSSHLAAARVSRLLRRPQNPLTSSARPDSISSAFSSAFSLPTPLARAQSSSHSVGTTSKHSAASAAASLPVAHTAVSRTNHSAATPATLPVVATSASLPASSGSSSTLASSSSGSSLFSSPTAYPLSLTLLPLLVQRESATEVPAACAAIERFLRAHPSAPFSLFLVDGWESSVLHAFQQQPCVRDHRVRLCIADDVPFRARSYVGAPTKKHPVNNSALAEQLFSHLPPRLCERLSPAQVSRVPVPNTSNLYARAQHILFVRVPSAIELLSMSCSALDVIGEAYQNVLNEFFESSGLAAQEREQAEAAERIISAPPQMRPLTVLVDGDVFFFRGHYALQKFDLRTSDGNPVSALLALSQTLLKLLNIFLDATNVAVMVGPTETLWRSTIDPTYKARRVDTPAILDVQRLRAKELCDAFSLPLITVPSHEADDIIATYTRMAVAQGHRVVIVSTDKDFYQLLAFSPHVRLYNPDTGILDALDVARKLGVSAEQALALKTLTGDKSDNVSGLVSDRKAKQLIEQHGSIYNILAFAETTDAAFAAQIRHNLRMVELRTDLNVPPLEPIERSRCEPFLRANGFTRILTRFGYPTDGVTPARVVGHANEGGSSE